MIFSATAIFLKLIGFLIPAFNRRPEAAIDAHELVAVSILLDEWCRRSSVNQGDPKAYATIARIVRLRGDGRTIEEVRFEILSEASMDAEDLDKGKEMQRFDLVDSKTASAYPGHVIIVAGDEAGITGELAVKDQSHPGQAEPLEAAIHQALLVKQRDALPIAVKDDLGLWPARLGELVPWTP
ncbi:hypothetical protein [Rhizobium sp. AN80A]|uniref:hypothetical protein n=1 Tax=Rhizobium sp. AN80A TaxID=3040673 RepID=UPI0024B387C3|nr:hypothetical protein [Rhizobium sp. AN80A]